MSHGGIGADADKPVVGRFAVAETVGGSTESGGRHELFSNTPLVLRCLLECRVDESVRCCRCFNQGRQVHRCFLDVAGVALHNFRDGERGHNRIAIDSSPPLGSIVGRRFALNRVARTRVI